MPLRMTRDEPGVERGSKRRHGLRTGTSRRWEYIAEAANEKNSIGALEWSHDRGRSQAAANIARLDCGPLYLELTWTHNCSPCFADFSA